MILGMSVATFTLVHVLISLVGIIAGAAALREMIVGGQVAAWNTVFLITTIATSVTGFLFHSQSFGPPHVIGVLSLIVLVPAVPALKGRRLEGRWRPAYVICATVALYLYTFVGVVQAFDKAPVLHQLAPTQSEAPFIVAQTVLLMIFAATGFVAFRRFAHARPDATSLLAG